MKRLIGPNGTETIQIDPKFAHALLALGWEPASDQEEQRDKSSEPASDQEEQRDKSSEPASDQEEIQVDALPIDEQTEPSEPQKRRRSTK